MARQYITSMTEEQIKLLKRKVLRYFRQHTFETDHKANIFNGVKTFHAINEKMPFDYKENEILSGLFTTQKKVYFDLSHKLVITGFTLDVFNNLCVIVEDNTNEQFIIELF